MGEPSGYSWQHMMHCMLLSPPHRSGWRGACCSDVPLPLVNTQPGQLMFDCCAPQVRQVWGASRENLVRKLGQATGTNLWNYAHGRCGQGVCVSQWSSVEC